MMHRRFASGVLMIHILCSAVPALAQESGEQESFEARIEKRTEVPCESGSTGCLRLTLEGTSGTFDNETIVIGVDPGNGINVTALTYEVGQRVIVQTQENNGQRVFFISDAVRRPVLLWLTLLFVAAVFAFGGFAAFRSFLGMIISFGVLFFFILPQILRGGSPLTITIIGSIVIMLVTFLVCHGWKKKTLAALGGTTASLLLTGLLAYVFAKWAVLTGTADEEMLFLLSDFPNLNAQGILLSGIIIGTLGVLDDITISQASAVFELKSANPRLSMIDLFWRAYRIGSDHIAAAMNTLVLAYAGTSLPLLLLIVGVPAGESLLLTINREMIAIEIVRTLVGSIGLLAAVPLTTLLASFLAVRSPADPADRLGLHRH